MATTRYVNGGSGSNANSCTSSSTACKTIGHAISLAASGDSIMVAAATYTENLTLAKNVKVIGSTTATIIDGGAKGIVIKISAGVSGTLQHLTIRNGLALNGGGILNYGTLAIKSCIITGNQTKSLGFGGRRLEPRNGEN
jgi:nitrous oxidase accessory protein NosD